MCDPLLVKVEVVFIFHGVKLIETEIMTSVELFTLALFPQVQFPKHSLTEIPDEVLDHSLSADNADHVQQRAHSISHDSV